MVELIKDRAKELYEGLPLPSSKYTNLSWWREEDFPYETSSEMEVSVPQGVEVLDAGEVGDVVPVNSWKFVAYHYMHLEKPFILKVPKGVRVEKPLRIRLNVRGREHFHLKLLVEEGGEVSVVVETSGYGLYTEVVEASVAEGAKAVLGFVENME